MTSCGFSIPMLTLLLVVISNPVAHAGAAQYQATALDIVRADGANLIRNGRTLQLFGVNHADLVWSFIQPGSVPENGAEVLAVAARYNITVVRYSAIGYNPDQVKAWMSDKSNFWSRYDRLIETATKLHIYLIPTLLWNPNQFPTVTGDQASDVFRSGTSSKVLFDTFVKELVSRYRSDTTILMWEIGNELNLLAKPRTSYYSTEELRTFMRETIGVIRSIDSIHLIGSGMAAPPHDVNPTVEAALHSFATFNDLVDVASIHTYPCDKAGHLTGTAFPCDQNGGVYGMTESDYIQLFSSASKNMTKPLMIGEFGDNLETNPNSSFSVGVLTAAFSFKVPLALMWEWMVPPDRDPSTRLVWSVDPQKTPFMTSVLQRFCFTAAVGESTTVAPLETAKFTSVSSLDHAQTSSLATMMVITMATSIIAVAALLHRRKKYRA